MKKTVMLLTLIAILSLTIASFAKRPDDKNGRWIYDSNNAKIGCESPGSSCSWD